MTALNATTPVVPISATDAGDFIPTAGNALFHLGHWYWVTQPESEQSKAMGDHETEAAPDTLMRPPVKGAWLGCLTHIGSNYFEVQAPRETGFTRILRVHFDEATSLLAKVENPEAVLHAHAVHFQMKSNALLQSINDLTQRLGLSTQTAVGHSSGSRSDTHYMSDQTSRALTVLNGKNNIAAYQDALNKAKEEELPALFEALAKSNAALTKWMSAPTLPLLVQAQSLQGTIASIDDRIFNVSIYAGLGETAIQVRDGEAAALNEKLRIMQRRLYMDEECLMNYRAGGMEFKDIGEYDQWLAQEENFKRILPFERCMVAMRVRRKTKEREWDGSLAQAIRQIKVQASDKFTFLYIRNGAQLWRLDLQMEFDELIFPDRHILNLAEPMMFLKSGRDISEMITVADFEARVAERVSISEKRNQWKLENPDQHPIHCPFRSDFEPSRWARFDQSSVYFDEAQAKLDKEVKYYNRIALIVQGLYDRSLVLHPHLPVQTWSVAGFEKAIELIYDSSYALTYGAAPNFEAYREALNATANVESMFVGQERFWMALEAERESARIDKDYRRRDKNYRPKLFQPYGNPGPGLVSKAHKIGARSWDVTFKWTRKRLRENAWGENSPVSCSVTVPIQELLNISAYKLGDYKRFFADPRTRQEYLQWAPLLLTAEDFLHGKLE